MRVAAISGAPTFKDLHIIVIPSSLKRLGIDCNGADTWEQFIPSYLHFILLWHCLNGNVIVEHIDGFFWMTFAPCCCWIIIMRPLQKWLRFEFCMLPSASQHIWAGVAHV